MRILLACLLTALLAAPAAAACELGTEHTVIVLPDVAANFRAGWHVRVSIGGGPAHGVQIDTGSIGVVIPASALGPRAKSTGEVGAMTYSSSGRVFRGTYYMADIALDVAPGRPNGQTRTVPIRVLAVDRMECLPGAKRCTHGADAAHLSGLGMMGVGFARGTGSPAANAFLQLEPMVAGSMHRGYAIARDRIVLGLTDADASGFTFVPLQPSTTTTGDWAATPGCVSFPGAADAPQCGTVLVDTGINYMIVGIPQAARPAGFRSDVPPGTQVSLGIPSASTPVVTYAFAAGPPAQLPDPNYVRWSSAKHVGAFVNTGRNLLAAHDYLYDAGCGRVGFRPVSR